MNNFAIGISALGLAVLITLLVLVPVVIYGSRKGSATPPGHTTPPVVATPLGTPVAAAAAVVVVPQRRWYHWPRWTWVTIAIIVAAATLALIVPFTFFLPFQALVWGAVGQAGQAGAEYFTRQLLTGLLVAGMLAAVVWYLASTGRQRIFPAFLAILLAFFAIPLMFSYATGWAASAGWISVSTHGAKGAYSKGCHGVIEEVELTDEGQLINDGADCYMGFWDFEKGPVIVEGGGVICPFDVAAPFTFQATHWRAPKGEHRVLKAAFCPNETTWQGEDAGCA